MAVAKRIVIYILVAVLTVGSIVPVVSADAYNEGDYSLIPLFSQTDEYYVMNGNLAEPELQNVHRVWSTGYSYIKWNTARDIYSQQIFFSVVVSGSSPFNPDRDVFAFVNDVEKNVVYLGSSGSIYYYRMDHYDNVYSIQIGQRGSFVGNFTIYDIYGTINDLVDLWFADFSMRGFYVNNQTSGTYMSNIGSESGLFPITLEKKGTSGDSFTLLSADGTLVVDTAQAPAAFYDYFVFDIYTCGTATDFGAVLLDDELNVEASLQVETDISGIITDYGVQFGSSTMHWPIYRMQVVVKTENFNLSGKKIQLVFAVDGVRLDPSNQNVQGVYAQIVRGFARPTHIDEPWYSNILGGIKTGFQSIVDKLDEVFNGDSEAESAADSLDQADDELSNLTPDINAGEVIDNYHIEIEAHKTDNGFVHAAMLVGGFWQMVPWEYLLYVCLFGLAGYLIFGKR